MAYSVLARTLALICAVGLAQAQAQLEAFPCDNIRRDWRTLTPGQQATYISAVNQLQVTRQYPNWLQVHSRPEMDRYAHVSPGLYPWHRYYIWNYENQLRSLGGVYSCISLPYWDWTADAAMGGGYINPASSQVYQAFGGAGQGQCIEQLIGSNPSPPFASFASFRYPDDVGGRFRGGCISRNHRRVRIPLPFEMLDVLTRQTSYAYSPGYNIGFYYSTVQAHNNIHNMIGGSQTTVASCYEPLFMLHHSFVDKLWATWQDCHGINNFPQVFKDDSLPTQWTANQEMPVLPGVSAMMTTDYRTIGGRGYAYAPSALEQTPQWQAAMANRAQCAGVIATGRLLNNQRVNVTIDQRTLDLIKSYSKYWDAAARTSNDTDKISAQATRKACEAAGSIDKYKEASEWAKMMGSTAPELLSAINSPCIDVEIGDIETAIAEARTFDRKMAKKMHRMKMAAVGRTLNFYPMDQ